MPSSEEMAASLIKTMAEAVIDILKYHEKAIGTSFGFITIQAQEIKSLKARIEELERQVGEPRE